MRMARAAALSIAAALGPLVRVAELDVRPSALVGMLVELT